MSTLGKINAGFLRLAQEIAKKQDTETLGAAVAADPAVREAFRPEFEAVGAATTRLRVGLLDDSTGAGGLKDASGNVVSTTPGWSFAAPYGIGQEQAGPLSYLTHACLRSGGRLLLVHNGAVANDTCTGLLARFDANVLPWNLDALFIGGGIYNSLNQSIPVATIRASIVEMIRRTRAAGIMPILTTAYPANNAAIGAGIRKHNAWLKTLAAGRDPEYPDISALIVVDRYAAVVDPASTTGAWLPAYSGDGVHATAAGAVAAADRILADLSGLLRGSANPWDAPFFPRDNVGGALNLSTNPMLLADSDANGIPDGIIGATPTGTTHEMVTIPGMPGKMYRCTVTTSGVTNRLVQFNIDGTIIKPGDRIKWAGVFDVPDAGSLAWYLRLQFPGSPVATYPIQPVSGINYPLSYFECEAVVPAGPTVMQAGEYSQTGVGKLGLGPWTFMNMTTGVLLAP